MNATSLAMGEERLRNFPPDEYGTGASAFGKDRRVFNV